MLRAIKFELRPNATQHSLIIRSHTDSGKDFPVFFESLTGAA